MYFVKVCYISRGYYKIGYAGSSTTSPRGRSHGKLGYHDFLRENSRANTHTHTSLLAFFSVLIFFFGGLLAIGVRWPSRKEVTAKAKSRIEKRKKGVESGGVGLFGIWQPVCASANGRCPWNWRSARLLAKLVKRSLAFALRILHINSYSNVSRWP